MKANTSDETTAGLIDPCIWGTFEWPGVTCQGAVASAMCSHSLRHTDGSSWHAMC